MRACERCKREFLIEGPNASDYAPSLLLPSVCWSCLTYDERNKESTLMSDVTMIATMLKHWTLTFDDGTSESRYRLIVWDSRLDTTSVYTSDVGVGNLIERAFEAYKGEYL
jgi:hypothetical protein